MFAPGGILLSLLLHRFFIAISWAVVHHDGGVGTSINPLVWCAGGAPKRRRVAVRNRAFFYLGRLIIGLVFGSTVAVTPRSCHDIEVWPCFVGMLVKWVAFLHSLHWPADGCNLGVGGVSCVELLILFEVWAGERLELEKAVPRNRRPGRSISVSAVPFGPGTDIWRSCRFIGALMRSLCLLLGGLRRFVPCSIGANHCRLRHIGSERCGHGLTCKCVLLSTSREVRKDMSDWALSFDGDKWSVKFDVRDLGGHLDTFSPFSLCFDFCSSSGLSWSGSGCWVSVFTCCPAWD